MNNKKLKKFLNTDKTFFIAEIGINHNASLKIAKKLIQSAKFAGCDAIKFQKRNPLKCVPKDQWSKVRRTPWGKMTYIDYKKKMEFSKKEYVELIKYCKKIEIKWFASCWDEDSVDFMENLNVPIYKVASASLTDINLLKRIKKTKKPVIISTGMSNLTQIKKAFNIYKNEIAVLHCNSSYPSENKKLNLLFISKLKKIFPRAIIGYSGHEMGLSTSLAAVVLGAKIIERHITLDKTMWGTDQKSSIEPLGFARLIRDTRSIEDALGESKKIVYKEEIEMQKKLRLFN